MKTASKILRREPVAEGTMAFFFEKPAGFQSKAGQAINLTLLDPPETDAAGSRRTFTIASAPFEDHVMITTRLRDTAFKRVLKTLPLGTPVRMDGPFGLLTLHPEASRPAVFLAGGIGITPFLSILRQADQEKTPRRLILFYSNRRPEDAAYLEEFQQIEKRNPNCTFVGTMTGMKDSRRPWAGETGYVNKNMLAKFIPDLAAPMYYLAGPPKMVAALHHTLKEAGVAANAIRTEEFEGY